MDVETGIQDITWEGDTGKLSGFFKPEQRSEAID